MQFAIYRTYIVPLSFILFGCGSLPPQEFSESYSRPDAPQSPKTAPVQFASDVSWDAEAPVTVTPGACASASTNCLCGDPNCQAGSQVGMAGCDDCADDGFFGSAGWVCDTARSLHRKLYFMNRTHHRHFLNPVCPPHCHPTAGFHETNWRSLDTYPGFIEMPASPPVFQPAPMPDVPEVAPPPVPAPAPAPETDKPMSGDSPKEDPQKEDPPVEKPPADKPAPAKPIVTQAQSISHLVQEEKIDPLLLIRASRPAP